MSTGKSIWKTQREGFTESLHYMRDRMIGVITSLRTPWPKFDDAGTAGLEWNSTLTIAGRPGSGKTLVKDQIIREAFRLNPTMVFRVLEFQFEMVARASAIREYSSVLGKSYKYLCSAGHKLTQEDLDACYAYAQEKVKYPIDIVEEPLTVERIREQIILYMKTHAKKETDGLVYMPTIISLDHALLVKKGDGEKDKQDTLYALGEMCTELKRKYPILFIILSQLNREIEKPERCEEGRYSNYILTSDVFGADAMLQHSDILVGIDRPRLRAIGVYGPERFLIETDDILVFSFLKCRNGDPRISFFKAEYGKMRVSEIEAPPRQEMRIKTKK